MQIVGLINGKNKNYDYQLTAANLALVNSGTLTAGSLEVTAGSVAAGSALIEVTRSNGQKVLVHYQNTAPVAVTTTGTTKIYVLVDQAKVDSGIANAADGTGIGAIASGASYPAGNFIPLASVTSGTITDERVQFSLRNVKRKGMGAKKVVVTDASGNETELSGSFGQAVGFDAGWTPTVFYPTVDVQSLNPSTAISDADSFVKFDPSDEENQELTFADLYAEILSRTLAETVPFVSSGTTSGSGTLTFTHGLGRVPRKIRVTAKCYPGSKYFTSDGVYNGTTYATCFFYSSNPVSEEVVSVGASSTDIMHMQRTDSGGGSPDQSSWAVTTFNATEVVLTKTVSNTDPGSIAYSVEIS